MKNNDRYVGLMSGTSLDGVDAVLLEFSGNRHRMIGKAFTAFDASLRARLLSLHDARTGELHEAAVTSNDLARIYAHAVQRLLADVQSGGEGVQAIGCHGQTIRHRPESGYTIQLGNCALLAELTGKIVVCDFRSRDIAAGGQGAPLVPAFHHAMFAHDTIHRVIVNIGGIANITDLNAGAVIGFDTGPGNMLMDAWIQRHRGEDFDRNGAWAKSGMCIPSLLAVLLDHEYFSQSAPKSTGRDLFNLGWLDEKLVGRTAEPRDVQATLLEFTARSISEAIAHYAAGVQEIYVCGGGAANPELMARLAAAFPKQVVKTTAALGIDPDWVEACAFAWLARQALLLRPGNLPAVTGAKGPRVLGAIYPA